MLNFAHVIDGVVQTVSQSEQPMSESWLAWAATEWDAVIDVTDLVPRPGIGWSYDGTTFTAPEAPLV